MSHVISDWSQGQASWLMLSTLQGYRHYTADEVILGTGEAGSTAGDH